MNISVPILLLTSLALVGPAPGGSITSGYVTSSVVNFIFTFAGTDDAVQ